jgi:hypothetical protein
MADELRRVGESLNRRTRGAAISPEAAMLRRVVGARTVSWLSGSIDGIGASRQGRRDGSGAFNGVRTTTVAEAHCSARGDAWPGATAAFSGDREGSGGSTRRPATLSTPEDKEGAAMDGSGELTRLWRCAERALWHASPVITTGVATRRTHLPGAPCPWGRPLTI